MKSFKKMTGIVTWQSPAVVEHSTVQTSTELYSWEAYRGNLAPEAKHYTHQVDVTQLVQPEVVAGCRGSGELVLLKTTVHFADGKRQATENPLVNQRLISR